MTLRLATASPLPVFAHAGSPGSKFIIDAHRALGRARGGRRLFSRS
jgi:hypothetical protein